MPRKKIHLIKATQARPFINTALRLGVPVKILADLAGLPVESVYKGEGVIGELSLWRFVDLAGRYPGCEHFGYITALDHPIGPSLRLGGMNISMAGSLKQILEIFCCEVVTESDSSDYQLVSKEGETWFTRKLVITEAPDGWQPELYVITIIIQMVRLCAPGDWLPGKIRIVTRSVPENVPAEWSLINIDWGCQQTELRIDESILNLPLRNADNNNPLISGEENDNQGELCIQDLVDRQIWSKHTGLKNAAAELGMSNSTLKRRLAELKTSYSEILARRRFHHGIRLLEMSDRSVNEIAGSLGYSSVTNFSRAFRKSAGVSPSTWRNNRSDRV
jgi:AraC-like DNA-binding protein